MTKTVIEEIAAERQRQIETEGWSVEHDDEHTRSELAMAAALYAAPAPLFQIEHGDRHVSWFDPWPWHDTEEGPRGGFVRVPAWDKRKKHPLRRKLVIAAALIVAEIERLDRKRPVMTVRKRRSPRTPRRSPH